MTGYCTDPKRGSVWITNRNGQLEKVSASSVHMYLQHPNTKNVIKVRHWKQVARLERMAEANGGVFEGGVVYVEGNVTLEHGRKIAREYFETGELDETGWGGKTNAEAVRGRRTPRRIGLIRSLATLNEKERAEVQVERRISASTAECVSWLSRELEKRSVKDTEIIQRLGRETRLELLGQASLKAGLEKMGNPHSHRRTVWSKKRVRGLMDKLDKLGFAADEVEGLLVNFERLRSFVDVHYNRGVLDTVQTFNQVLLERAKRNCEHLERVKGWKETRLQRVEGRVELVAEVLAGCKSHPVLGELDSVAAVWLATSNIEVDERFDSQTWELMASDMMLGEFGVRLDDDIDIDAEVVKLAELVDGDCIKYRIMSEASRTSAGSITRGPERKKFLENLAVEFNFQNEGWQMHATNQLYQEALLFDTALEVAQKLGPLGRRETVDQYGTLIHAAWAHTLPLGLNLREARALVDAVEDGSASKLVSENSELTEMLRKLPTGSLRKALVAAKGEHDIKWLGVSRSVVDGDDQIITDELGFKHRTRRRSRRTRRDWHPSVVDSATRLAYCFNKSFPAYLEAGKRAGRAAQNRDVSIHELTYWLPVGPHSGEFGQWLSSKRRVQAIFSGASGEIGLRRVAEEFKHLTEANKTNLSVSDTVAWLRAQGYGGLGMTPLGMLAGELDVSPQQLNRVAGRWAKSLKTPSVLPLTAQWEDETNGLSARFLPRSDPRGLYLGHLTDCCQYPGSAGEACAWAGCEQPLHGFFVVEDKKGTVLAQSWVWSDGHGGLCFDNVERKTSTSDGWNADWGVRDSELEDDKKLTGAQRRSAAIRRLYEKAANDCLDSFEIVTIGSSMTKIPLKGLNRAKGDEVLSPWNYNGYRDSHNQAVLAKRTAKQRGLKVIGTSSGFAWEKTKHVGKAGAFRLEVNDNSVTVTSLEEEGVFGDETEVRKQVLELLRPMGPRHWKITIGDSRQEVVDVRGDSRLAVADASVYDMEEYNRPVDVSNDPEYKRKLAWDKLEDTEEAQELWKLGLSKSLRECHKQVLDGVVSLDDLRALSIEAREELEVVADSDMLKLVGEGRLLKLEAKGLDGRTACLMLMSEKQGEKLDEQVAVKLVEQLSDLRGQGTVSGLLNQTANIYHGHYSPDILSMFQASTTEEALATLKATDGHNLMYELAGMKKVVDEEALKQAAPFLKQGRRLGEAVALSRMLADDLALSGWDPEDLDYQARGVGTTVTAGQVETARIRLAKAGIKAREWAKLPARVQHQVLASSAVEGYELAGGSKKREDEVNSASRILQAATKAGVKAKTASRYPNSFQAQDIAEAMEAGVTPEEAKNTPDGLAGPDLRWLVDSGMASWYGTLKRRVFKDQDELLGLDSETRRVLEQLGAQNSLSGQANSELTGLKAVAACGLSEKQLDECPRTWSVAQCASSYQQGSGKKEHERRRRGHRLLYGVFQPEHIDSYLDAGLDVNDLEELIGDLRPQHAIACALAGVKPSDAGVLKSIALPEWVSMREYKSEKMLERGKDLKRKAAALSKMKNKKTAVAMAELSSRCLGQEASVKALNEWAKVKEVKKIAETAEQVSTMMRHQQGKLLRGWRYGEPQVELSAKEAKQAANAVLALAGKEVNLGQALWAGMACAESELEGLQLSGQAAQKKMTGTDVKILDKAGIERNERARMVRELEEDEWRWVFEGVSGVPRKNTTAVKRVKGRAKLALSGLENLKQQGSWAETVCERTGVGPKKVARAAASGADLEKLAESSLSGKTVEKLLGQKADSAEVEAVETAIEAGMKEQEAVRLVKLVREGVDVKRWASAGASEIELEELTAKGWEAIDGVDDQMLVILARRGVDARGVKRAVEAASAAGIDVVSFNEKDWEKAVAGSAKLTQSEGGLGSLLQVGLDEAEAKTVSEAVDFRVLDSEESRQTLRWLASDEPTRETLVAVAKTGRVDSLQAVVDVCENWTREDVEALSGEVVKLTGGAVKLPASVTAKALDRSNGAQWVAGWQTTAPHVPSEAWVEAEEVGWDAKEAEAWFKNCTRFSPKEARRLADAGCSSEQAMSLDTTLDVLEAAGQNGLLAVGGEGLSGQTLEGVVESKLGCDVVEELVSRGVTWPALTTGEAAVLWRRGCPTEDMVRVLGHLQEFPARNAASFSGRVRSFTQAGLTASDAGWFTDCSAKIAKELVDDGCTGEKYGELLAKHRQLGLDADHSVHDRRRQLRRWWESGALGEDVVQVQSRAQEHAATLR